MTEDERDAARAESYGILKWLRKSAVWFAGGGFVVLVFAGISYGSLQSEVRNNSQAIAEIKAQQSEIARIQIEVRESAASVNTHLDDIDARMARIERLLEAIFQQRQE